MKAYRVFGIALVTGTDAELDKLEQVAAGTHHVHKDPKGGPRKAKGFDYSAEEQKPSKIWDGVPVKEESHE